jgi:hypothetical protein
MASSHDLQRRADQARERLSKRLGELSDQLSPAAIFGDLLSIDYDQARQDVTQFVSKHVRGNPLAFALIAAGVGWLLISDAGTPLSNPRPSRATPLRRKRRRTRARPPNAASSSIKSRIK